MEGNNVLQMPGTASLAHGPEGAGAESADEEIRSITIGYATQFLANRLHETTDGLNNEECRGLAYILELLREG